MSIEQKYRKLGKWYLSTSACKYLKFSINIPKRCFQYSANILHSWHCSCQVWAKCGSQVCSSGSSALPKVSPNTNTLDSTLTKSSQQNTYIKIITLTSHWTYKRCMASQSQQQWVQTRIAHIYDVTNVIILIIGRPIGILRHLWLISVISGIFLLLSLFGFLNPIFLKWELILGSNKNHFSLHKDWGREGGGNPVFDILVSKLELQYLLVTRTFTKNPVTNFVKHLEYEYSICFNKFSPK